MLRSSAGTARIIVLCRRLDRRHRGGDQFPSARDIGFAGGAGEQPVMADPVKPLGQYVQQKAPDELVRRQGHCAEPLTTVAAVILIAESHALV